MSLWQNARSRETDESAVLERTEAAVSNSGVTADSATHRNGAPARPLRVVERPPSERPEQQDDAEHAGATSDAVTEQEGSELPAARPELGFSRDLVDTYFRQMGNAELLSREGEIALAKRIEAAQQAVLKGLCRVPLAIERIDQWSADWRAGTLRIDQLVDPSMSDSDLLDAGSINRSFEGQAEAEPTEEETPGAQDAGGAASPDSRFGPDVMAKLEQVADIAHEIVRLRRKGAAAVARGKAMTKADQNRLAKNFAALGGEVTNLRLHPERVNELTVSLDTEHRAMQMAERKLARLSGRGDREQREALTRELGAIEARVGLPLPEFRSAVSDMRKALREVRTAREEMVTAHLRLVVAIAKKYRGRSSLDLLDLIQDGKQVLMHAVKKFNYRRG